MRLLKHGLASGMMQVVSEAINCTAAIAQGMRKEYGQQARVLVRIDEFLQGHASPPAAAVTLGHNVSAAYCNCGPC